VFELGEKERFVVTCGGAPADRTKYLAELKAIMATVARAKPEPD
jgi:hypothetical protein